jgi:Domain of unknown function (DUF6471)
MLQCIKFGALLASWKHCQNSAFVRYYGANARRIRALARHFGAHEPLCTASLAKQASTDRRRDRRAQSPDRPAQKHGLEETGASITNKLSRGTFAATFFFATLAALEAEGVRLEDI